MLPHFVGPVGAVEQKLCAGRRQAQDIHALQEMELMAAHEIRRCDEIGRADRTRTEAQMGHRLHSGLVRVVNEISLRVKPGVLGDDLGAVLVGADGTVCAQAEEHGTHYVVRFRRIGRIDVEAGVRHVVVDADSEAVPRLGLLQLIEDRLGHRGCEVLRRQAEAAADHPGELRPAPLRHCLSKRLHHIEIEGLATRCKYGQGTHDCASSSSCSEQAAPVSMKG